MSWHGDDQPIVLSWMQLWPHCSSSHRWNTPMCFPPSPFSTAIRPPLPHDYRIRPTKKKLEKRPISFITRDLALLTYFDYLAGRLEIKPDPDRVARICPNGVPEPPADIVEFFARLAWTSAARPNMP